jgi:hypothetical protein
MNPINPAGEPPLDNDTVYLNGVNAVTGDYLVPPAPMSAFASLIKGQSEDPQTRVLSRMGQMLTSVHLGLPIDRDPTDLGQAGWGIVFHSDVTPEVRAALQPLIEHRRRQAGDLVKVLDYKTGEGRAQWLARFRVAAGSVDPGHVPYYLLLVGSPSQIPFTFGFLLDVEYAIGRIHFDTPGEYAAYARDVISSETQPGAIKNNKETLFFATRHPLDGATRLSADQLIRPLAGDTPQKYAFRSRSIWGKEATRAVLIDALHPADGKPPAIFFSATHGVAGWPPGDPSQQPGQGALLCQDWPGLGNILPAHYFAAADLPDDAQVHGMIAFLFACYSLGTPQFDRYFHQRNAPPPEIAKEPFFARLPQKMLAHPKGGALACIGHVERAWGCSISAAAAGPQLIPFQNVLGSLMKGVPVGHAMQDFNLKFASLSAEISTLLEDIGFGAEVSDSDLAARWLERNDAEGYAIFGDPAVRLQLGELT